MAKSVELDTVAAQQNIKALREQLKSLGKVAGLTGREIQQLGKPVTQLGNDFAAMSRKVNSLEKQVNKLKEAAKKTTNQSKAATAQNKKEADSWKRTEAGIKKLLATLKAQEGLTNRVANAVNRAFTQNIKLSTSLKSLGGSDVPIKKLNTAFDAYVAQLNKADITTDELGAATRAWSVSVREAELAVKAQTKRNKEADETMRRLEKAMSGVATKKHQNNVRDMNEFIRDLGSSAVFAVGPLSGIGARFAAFGAVVGRSGLKVAAITLGFVAFAAISVKLAGSLIRVGLQVDKITGTLRAATGSMGEAMKQFSFVSDLSVELGLNLAESANQFAKLSVAAKGTALEGEGAKEIFESVAIAGTAMRLSTEQMTGALRAIEQMISKGNVQAEELRGQLGERLPGAFSLAARAMGVTTQELNKMLENGEVLAEDLLPKLAKVLKESFTEEATRAAGKLSSQIERFKTLLFEALDELGKFTSTMELTEKAMDSANRRLEAAVDIPLEDKFKRITEAVEETETRLKELLATPADDIIRLLQTEELGIFGEIFSSAETKQRALEDATKQYGRILRDAFIRAQIASEELFAVTEEELDKLGERKPIQLLEFPKNLAGEKASGQGPANAPFGPNAALFEATEMSDKLADALAGVRKEFDRIGDTDLKNDLADVNIQMQQTIKLIETAPGIDKFMEVELVREARIAFAALADEIKRLADEAEFAKVEEITKAFDDLISSEEDLQGIARLRLAGRDAEADKLEIIRDIQKELGDDIAPELVLLAAAQRIETEKMTSELEEQDNLAEQAIKDAKAKTAEIAKQRAEAEKLTQAFVNSAVSLRDRAKVIQTELSFGKEAAKVEQFRLQQRAKFPDDAKRVETLVSLFEINLRLLGLLKEQNDERRVADQLEKKIVSQRAKLVADEASAENQIAVLQARLAGEDDIADALELQFALKKTFSELDETELDDLKAKLGLINEMTEALKEQAKAKAETEKLAGDTKDLQRANAILRLRIRGEEELANMLETRFDLMEKFPGKTAEELAELMRLMNANKELTAILKEQTEAEKERKKLAADFSKVIAKGFEDAIIAGKSLSDVLQTLLEDIQRIILRVLVTKPLENFLTGVLSGEDLTGSKAGPGGTPFFGGILGKLLSSEPSVPGNFGGGRAGGVGTPGVGGGFGGGVAGGGAASGSFLESIFNTLGIEARGTPGIVPDAQAKAMEKVTEAAKTTASTMEGELVGGILETVSAETLEKAATTTLTGSLFELKVAAVAAANALQQVAIAGAAGGGAGGGSDLSSILNFGSSFGGNPGAPFGGGTPGFVPGFGFTGPRQHGGPTGPNSPVLVGEDGPEIFRPNRVGVIAPVTGDGDQRAPVVNLTQVIHTETPADFRRSARSNLRVGAKAAKSAFRRT